MSQNDSLDRRAKEGLKKADPGPFIARVINNLDFDYMGTIRVQVMHEGTNGSQVPGQIISARYMSAYWGNTGSQFNGNADTFQETQTSWGMWIPTPDIGTQVIVIYIEGNSKNAFWIGAFPDRNRNFMVPGAAATTLNSKDQSSRLPVAEFNKNTNKEAKGPATNIIKPVHLLADVFTKQGIDKDDTRGITSSSARRETPSKVFGINTPGPIDVTSSKKTINAGDTARQTWISKLGGSSFVMDDGDVKYVRKTAASDGPPEYVTLESGSGEQKIPHNELIRLRTRTGHQILLHNSEDLIYIGNAKGTTWIELTSNGKIDIFAEDSISIHTKNDLNITAARDINLDAGRDLNIKAKNVVHAEALAVEFLSNSDTKITTAGNLYLKTTGNHIEKAAQVYMNTLEALPAIPLKTFLNPTEEQGGTVESIALRVPTHEPYPHHENLNPKDFLPTKTDRKSGVTIPAPSKWKQYTTPEDTFKQGR